MKRDYAGARADDLTWILGPTTQVVEVMTGTRFAWQPGEGYLNGAALSGAFAEHALVVVLMPLVVIIFAGAMVAIAHALRTAVRSIAAQRGPTERSDADDDEAACNFAGATVPGRRP